MSDKDFISSDYEWHRSSFCASGACVDVRRDGDVIVVRDGKLGDRSIEQTFSLERWPRLLSALANGEDHPDVLADDGYVRLGRVTPLFFTADEWTAFVAGVKNGEFEIERLSPGEAGSGFRGVARSGHAATGAGAIAVPPVPVAAQPRYILDKDAILELVGRYAEACVEAATTGSPKGREDAREQIRDLWDAIRAALTPVPASEPEPAWGSGPLVEHNPSSDADTELPYLTGQPVSFVDDGDGRAARS